MPQFRDQFDAAQSPRAAAYALKLGLLYDAFIGGDAFETAVFALIDRIIVDEAGTFILDESGNFIYESP